MLGRQPEPTDGFNALFGHPVGHQISGDVFGFSFPENLQKPIMNLLGPRHRPFAVVAFQFRVAVDQPAWLLPD